MATTRRGLNMTVMLLLLLTIAADSPRLVSAGIGGMVAKELGHMVKLVMNNFKSGSPSVEAKPLFLKSSPSPSPSPLESPSPSPDSMEEKLLLDFSSSKLSKSLEPTTGPLIPSQSPKSMEEKEKCSYAVTVKTTCSKEAGTTDPVSLRFGDSSSVDIMVLPLSNRLVEWLDSSNQNATSRPFQACSVDKFQVEGPCVNSTICFLYLKLSGADAWQPVFARVTVQDMPDLSSGYFNFGRYLPRGTWIGQDVCDSEVTPFGIKHKRRV